jgi:hypothetical protein
VLLQLEVSMCIDGVYPMAFKGVEIICDNVAFLGVLGIGTR